MSLLDNIGLSALITKMKNTFATKTELAGKQDELSFDSVPTESSQNVLTSGSLYTALENKQQKITYVNYFPSYNNTTQRPSNSILNTSFSSASGQRVTDVGFGLNSGVLNIGYILPPSYENDSFKINNEACSIVAGRIGGTITKQYYEEHSSNLSGYSGEGKINFPTLGNSLFKNIIGIAIAQDYDSNITTPITIVPFYRTVNGESYISGIYCLHDTSSTVTGYYVAVLGDLNVNVGG